MVPKLNLGQQVVYRDMLDLVKKHASLVPNARVAMKENAKGELVIAVIVPTPMAGVRD
jgi:hypothetical protein